MFLAQAARQFEIWTGRRAPSAIFEYQSILGEGKPDGAQP
jgi:shikimate 5-dehydrogenase